MIGWGRATSPTHVKAQARWALFAGALVLAGLLHSAPAAAAAGIEESIHEFTLDNGLRVILVERHHAPIVHVNLMFKVGGVDEPPGLGGISHMVEHMAIVGASEYGSLDLEEELSVLDELEDVVAALREAERAAAAGEDRSEEIEALNERFEALKAQAEALAEVYAIPNILAAHGAVGLNAATGYDYTFYVTSLPSNRFELWARLIGDAIRARVFRHFYSEVDVVKEERRYRTEDDPDGLLIEHFLKEAFRVHPYGRPLIGTMEEISGYTARKAKEYWQEHYRANRAVLTVAGDLDPDETMAIIARYFGGLPAGPPSSWDIPTEPEQQGERRVTVTFDAEPRVMIGYHKPTYPHRDAYVFDVIHAILSSGRTSRLFSRMVNQDQIALSINGNPNFPATRFPNLLVYLAMPRHPHGPEEIERAFYEEIERLKSELVDPLTLEKAQNRVRADWVRMLNSDPALIKELAFHELTFGDWRKLFEYPEIISTITAEEIRDVARRYLTEENRTVAILVPERGDAQ